MQVDRFSVLPWLPFPIPQLISFFIALLLISIVLLLCYILDCTEAEKIRRNQRNRPPKFELTGVFFFLVLMAAAVAETSPAKVTAPKKTPITSESNEKTKQLNRSSVKESPTPDESLKCTKPPSAKKSPVTDKFPESEKLHLAKTPSASDNSKKSVKKSPALDKSKKLVKKSPAPDRSPKSPSVKKPPTPDKLHAPIISAEPKKIPTPEKNSPKPLASVKTSAPFKTAPTKSTTAAILPAKALEAKGGTVETRQSKESIKGGKETPKSKTVELLKIGETLRGRYAVEAKLGRGGCGQIYRGYDSTKSRPVAVKIAAPEMDPRRMKIEQIILTLLRGKSHFPTLFGMGQVRGLPYLVMELVGRNLSDLRKRQPEKRLQPITVYRVSMQVISALQYIHSIGFLHRDIKPSNFCIGRGRQRRVIYLLDHGMARMFTEIDGTFRTARKYAGFRGTLRYVSLTVHSRQETGPCDDLIGWLYSMIELINGRLPWSDLTGAKEIEQSKINQSLENLCANQPNTSLEFAKYITSLKRTNIPDYDKMYAMFKTVAQPSSKEDVIFEWEKNRPETTEKMPQERITSPGTMAGSKKLVEKMQTEKTQSSKKKNV